MIKSSRRSTMKTASTLIASSILSFLLLSTSTTLAQDPQETLALYEPPDGQVMFGAWVQTEWVHTLYSECIVDAVAAAVLSVCSLCVTPTLCLAPYLFNMLVLGWNGWMDGWMAMDGGEREDDDEQQHTVYYHSYTLHAVHSLSSLSLLPLSIHPFHHHSQQPSKHLNSPYIRRREEWRNRTRQQQQQHIIHTCIL